jgi:hypothetical protein
MAFFLLVGPVRRRSGLGACGCGGPSRGASSRGHERRAAGASSQAPLLRARPPLTPKPPPTPPPNPPTRASKRSACRWRSRWACCPSRWGAGRGYRATQAAPLGGSGGGRPRAPQPLTHPRLGPDHVSPSLIPPPPALERGDRRAAGPNGGRARRAAGAVPPRAGRGRAGARACGSRRRQQQWRWRRRGGSGSGVCGVTAARRTPAPVALAPGSDNPALTGCVVVDWSCCCGVHELQREGRRQPGVQQVIDMSLRSVSIVLGRAGAGVGAGVGAFSAVPCVHAGGAIAAGHCGTRARGARTRPGGQAGRFPGALWEPGAGLHPGGAGALGARPAAARAARRHVSDTAAPLANGGNTGRAAQGGGRGADEVGKPAQRARPRGRRRRRKNPERRGRRRARRGAPLAQAQRGAARRPLGRLQRRARPRERRCRRVGWERRHARAAAGSAGTGETQTPKRWADQRAGANRGRSPRHGQGDVSQAG